MFGIEIKNLHVNIKGSNVEEVQKWVEEHPELAKPMRIATEAFKED